MVCRVVGADSNVLVLMGSPLLMVEHSLRDGVEFNEKTDP